MNGGLKIDAVGLVQGLERLQSKSDLAVRALAETGALKMQSYAQKNARWTDRTGAARQRLNGSVEKRVNGYAIAIAHGVQYGIYLEFDYEKRYAILPDTLREVGQNEVMPAFEKLLERLNR